MHISKILFVAGYIYVFGYAYSKFVVSFFSGGGIRVKGLFSFFKSRTSDTSWGDFEKEQDEIEIVAKNKIYVSANWINGLLAGKLEESADYIILECSWGEESLNYKKGHIKGAYHLNTDMIEDDITWNLRTAKEIEEVLKKYGISKDTTVICYSDSAMATADDRVAFALLWAGVENVKCLNGGLEIWKSNNLPLEKGSNKPLYTNIDFGADLPVHPEYIISTDTVRKKLETDKNFRLVSIRSRNEFLGKTSGYPYIEKAGEPKGAVWGHDTDDGSYNNEDKSIVGIEKLKEYLAESKSSFENEVVFYCGTGWRAAVPFLIAYENNYITKLYDGGWHEWLQTPDNPVQLGDPESETVTYTTVAEI